MKMMRYPEGFDVVSKRHESVGFTMLLPAEQLVYCIWWLEGEVNNGGFHQFFLNSAGDLYLETVRALEDIGATKTSALLQAAAREAFGTSVPSDRDERIDALIECGEQLIDSLYKLDCQFYKYEDRIEDLVNEYLTAQRT